jgi:ribosomal protein S18 acetylase RimI-like enzyme
MVSGGFDDMLLRRIEDAGLNASAPPQQRWLDGWLVRCSPGKAKRARCINAVAAGVRPAADKLAECEALYREAGLPFFFRITPFTQPAALDSQLAERGWAVVDDTCVMVRASLGDLPSLGVPDGITQAWAGAADYAQAVGALRGSSAPEIEAHAQRLALSPVPYAGLLWRRADAVVACGQFAREGPVAGLYDVFTAPAARGAGLAGQLCTRLLSRARDDGATAAYLQVESSNLPARAVYHRLGFADGYRYHYRCADASAH